MIHFIVKNLVDILLVIVGTFAFITYLLQEHRKKIDAASLIVLQINEMQENLRKISTYIVEGQINETAFYESLLLMEENYWNKYKHYFVRNMDSVSYNSFNELYTYVIVVQEQLSLMKDLQKNNFHLIQTSLMHTEMQFINNYLNNLFQQDITQNLNFYEFLNTYKQQDEKLKYIINSKVLTPYNPVQIAISLEKVLKEYSMLEVTGTEGFQMLKKISKKKF